MMLKVDMLNTVAAMLVAFVSIKESGENPCRPRVYMLVLPHF